LSRSPPYSTLFPYTTLFRSFHLRFEGEVLDTIRWRHASDDRSVRPGCCANIEFLRPRAVEPGRYVTHSHIGRLRGDFLPATGFRSEEHTSELQSRENLVCRL